jgi:hypothetical protein
MNGEDLARIALTLPEVEAKSHFDTPDFRVNDKIFATLKNDRLGVLKLLPEQQEMLTSAEPEVFSRLNNKMGLQGWTEVYLAGADEKSLRAALILAWRNVVTKKLQATLTS